MYYVNKLMWRYQKKRKRRAAKGANLAKDEVQEFCIKSTFSVVGAYEYTDDQLLQGLTVGGPNTTSNKVANPL